MHHSLSFGRLGNPSEREGRVNGRGKRREVPGILCRLQKQRLKIW